MRVDVTDTLLVVTSVNCDK